MWHLPGPRAFVTELRASLERGDQVTLAAPRGFDGGSLGDQLRHVTPSFTFDSVHLPDLDQSASPPEALADALGAPVPPDEIGSPEHLAAASELRALLVWLSGVGDLAEEHRASWAAFLNRYARAARSLGVDQAPPQFVLDATGCRVGDLVLTEPGWSTAWWWGRLGRLDTAVMLAEEYPDTSPVRRMQAVELAGFDLALAVSLTACESGKPEEIAEVVRGAASGVWLDREESSGTIWCDRDAPGRFEAAWSKGAVDRFDGEDAVFWHVAHYIDEPRFDTLRRRLWSGQIRAYLPRLEEWRILLIDRAKAEGFIATGFPLDQLEFASLHQQLRASASPRRRRELAEFAGWLREARNELAHLRVLDPTEIARGEGLAISALRI